MKDGGTGVRADPQATLIGQRPRDVWRHILVVGLQCGDLFAIHQQSDAAISKLEQETVPPAVHNRESHARGVGVYVPPVYQRETRLTCRPPCFHGEEAAT